MVTIEMILPAKIVIIGPFEDQDQAVRWVRVLMREHPDQKALITAHDDHPENLRVYVGVPMGRPAEGFFSHVFDVFESAGKQLAGT